MEKGPKQPMYIRVRGGGLFAFAGLWEVWKSPEGDRLHTFTIITAEPNELVSKIHNRMPAILLPENEAAESRKLHNRCYVSIEALSIYQRSSRPVL